MSVRWNPWHGCHKITPGCQNCYVYRIDSRYDRDSQIVQKTKNFSAPIAKRMDGSYRIEPGQTVYTCFSSDFLVEEADDWRLEAFEMMKLRSDLVFFFITKRIDRLQQLLPPDWGEGYPNIVVGCTVEDQQRANERLPIFAQLPIRKKIIICGTFLAIGWTSLRLVANRAKTQENAITIGCSLCENRR